MSQYCAQVCTDSICPIFTIIVTPGQLYFLIVPSERRPTWFHGVPHGPMRSEVPQKLRSRAPRATQVNKGALRASERALAASEQAKKRFYFQLLKAESQCSRQVLTR